MSARCVAAPCPCLGAAAARQRPAHLPWRTAGPLFRSSSLTLAQRPLHIAQRPLHIAQRPLHIALAQTENQDLELGVFQAPEFELLEPLTGSSVRLTEYAAGAPATMLMFICNHCPFVIHLKPAITQLAQEYQAKGVKVLAISSNSVETHPQDGPEAMAQDAQSQGYSFPYLYDESQEVAKAYSAACTPEFLVFDSQLRLAYHGQFDSSRPSKYGGSTEASGEDLRHALDCVLEGRPNERKLVKSIGCNIKWHPGKAPAWFHG